MTNNARKMAPGPVLSELNYLEFHREKGKLENGTYRVIEHDGEINYVVLGDCRGLLMFDIDWYTEDEYIDYRESDSRLNAIMDFDPDLDEDLMDSWDIAMHQPIGVSFPLDQHNTRDHSDYAIKGSDTKTLGEILREFKGTDVRHIVEAQYAEHCESVDQDRRDGVML